MAKITYGTGLGDYGLVADFYDLSLQLQEGKSSTTEVNYKDSKEAGNDKIEITGTGFAWEGDTMTAGTITGINFTNKTGSATYMTFKELSLTVDDFNDAYVANGVQGVVDLLVRGNDTMTGSEIDDEISAGDGKDVVHAGEGNDRVLGGAKGDRLYGEAGADYIWGDTGNDRMWGGRGSDKFQFQTGDDRDVIVDFDAKGGGKKQDYLSLYTGDEFTIHKANHNHDTLLDFGDGDTLLLVDVKRADFSRSGDIDWLAV